LDILIELVSIYYCSMLMWEGWLLAYESLIYNEVSSGGVRWPLFPFQVVVPIGGMLVIIILSIRIIANIRYLMGKGKPLKVLIGGH
jgi:TRAP-type C4-dicarboxylate transport system permease small subunit